MRRILDITQKDLLQMLRDRRTFMFLLIMPVAFTLLFGYAFGGFSGGGDSRLPVGFLDEDNSALSHKLRGLLAASTAIRLEDSGGRSAHDLEQLVADNKLAAALRVPAGYGKAVAAGRPIRLSLIADTTATAGATVQAEALSAAYRLDNAVRTAAILEDVIGAEAPFDYTLDRSLAAWRTPPIAVSETISPAVKALSSQAQSLAHTSPGMMLQFAIAGLLTAAGILVNERKSRAVQRLLTTATRRVDILLGHYLAMGLLIFGQFLLLIAFGQVILKVNYLRDPVATLLVAVSAAACIAALGLVIGVLARSEEQAVIFSLAPMFVLSGLGGAWVPLEVTGPTFQAIGHLSPVAWAMDGFKDVILRGLGVQAVLLPAAALTGYAVFFFLLAVWRFNRAEEH